MAQLVAEYASYLSRGEKRGFATETLLRIVSGSDRRQRISTETMKRAGEVLQQADEAMRLTDACLLRMARQRKLEAKSGDTPAEGGRL